MTNTLFILLGISSTVFVYILLKSLITSSELIKPNYSGKSIPTLGGLIVLIAFLVGTGIERILPLRIDTYSDTNALVILALGFGLIGLIDDLIGDKSRQGFKGHLTELIKGRITTGTIKLFGGPIIAAIAISPNISSDGYIRFFLNIIAISLLANLFNLFDLAPGRTSKYALFVVAICLIISSQYQREIYIFIGILCVSLIFDIREKYMLGDTGSNIIGAVVGLMVVTISSTTAITIVVLMTLILNLISEFVSFSQLIDSFVPLRLLDEIGQTKSRRAHMATKRSDASKNSEN